MTTLRDWGPSDDRALDRWLTRGDLDDRDPEEDEVLPDCHGGAELGPDARPCGACAECLRHAAERADEGESPDALVFGDGRDPAEDFDPGADDPADMEPADIDDDSNTDPYTGGWEDNGYDDGGDF